MLQRGNIFAYQVADYQTQIEFPYSHHIFQWFPLLIFVCCFGFQINILCTATWFFPKQFSRQQTHFDLNIQGVCVILPCAIFATWKFENLKINLSTTHYANVHLRDKIVSKSIFIGLTIIDNHYSQVIDAISVIYIFFIINVKRFSPYIETTFLAFERKF